MQQLRLALSVLLLLGAYAAVDALVRGELVDRVLRKVFGQSGRSWFLGSCITAAGLSVFAPWPQGQHNVQLLTVGLCGMLAWNAATRDFDVTQSQQHRIERLLLPFFALLSYYSPIGLLLTLLVLSKTFHFWLHHATFPMRLAQVLLAYGLVLGAKSGASLLVAESTVTLEPALPEALWLVLLVVQVSHYLITALAKMWLGPKWYSWAQDNQLHHLAASAYSWGWARFVAWPTYLKLVHFVKRVEQPLQWGVFALEILSPLVLLNPRFAPIFCVLAALFHMGVFALSGLLFWDWIGANLLLLGFYLSPQSVGVSGTFPLLLGVCVLAVFPLRHKLWKPMPLGWFDTPLTTRIHWEVIGESGTVYEVYNNFMCPHERLYGRVNGCFFSPHPVMTYHLGEVWKPGLRKEIISAGPNKEVLDELRKKYGILPGDPRLRQRHLNYLSTLFFRLNRGDRKAVLPRALRWLKAPGDQTFYWGDTPAYKRQERVTKIRLRFREEYFEKNAHVCLSDQIVATCEVLDHSPCAEELRPKQLDDYLLGLAQGRLIDLPPSKKSYTEILAEI